METVHRLIEDEFYEVESFRSRKEFLAKAAAYNLWFNVARPNSYKEHKTPWEIIHKRDSTISPAVVALPPLFLDELFVRKLDSNVERGYDLIPYPYCLRQPDFIDPKNRLGLEDGKIDGVTFSFQSHQPVFCCACMVY